jgi:hypothetical protein
MAWISMCAMLVRQDSLEFRQLRVEIHTLDADQVEVLIDDGSSELICGQLETEK